MRDLQKVARKCESSSQLQQGLQLPKPVQQAFAMRIVYSLSEVDNELRYFDVSLRRHRNLNLFWCAPIDGALNFVARCDVLPLDGNEFVWRIPVFGGNLQAACAVNDAGTNRDDALNS